MCFYSAEHYFRVSLFLGGGLFGNESCMNAANIILKVSKEEILQVIDLHFGQQLC